MESHYGFEPKLSGWKPDVLAVNTSATLAIVIGLEPTYSRVTAGRDMPFALHNHFGGKYRT